MLSVKHGSKSIMVQECFVGERKSRRFDSGQGNHEKDQYHSIFQRHAIPSGLCIIGKKITFQQDNDPKHSTKLCQNFK